MSFLQTFKNVHIKIPKEVYSKFRILLFKKDISAQLFFQEIAGLLVSEDPSVTKLLEKLVLKKTNKEIVRNTKPAGFTSELDNETLYNLLEGHSPLKEDSEELEEEYESF